MTSLNYCSKFLEFWRERRYLIPTEGEEWRCGEFAAKLLKEAHIFQLPPGGRTVNTSCFMPGDWAECLHLPFPVTAFEYVDGKEKLIVIAFPANRVIRGAEGIACNTAISDEEGDWIGSTLIESTGAHMVYHFKEEHEAQLREEAESCWRDADDVIRDMRKLGKALGSYNYHMFGKHLENVDGGRKRDIVSVVQALVTLHCKNASYVRTEAPAVLNKKRLAAGKLPLLPYHVIHIDGKPIESGEPLGGTHGSPRRHFRRAHIRRYDDGSTTWVRHTIVNPGRSDSVGQTYNVHMAKS